MGQTVKKTNICRWLESEFPKDLYGNERCQLDIRKRKFDEFEDVDRNKENLFAPKVGAIVDIATNLAMYGYQNEFMNDIIGGMRRLEYDLFERSTFWWVDPKNETRYCRYDYQVMLEQDFNRMGELRVELREKGVTHRAIRLINYFIKYVDFSRQGYKNLWKTIEPTDETVDNIRMMVSRNVNFLRHHDDIKGPLMFANSAMCKKINTGSIDFYNEDVMIDIKVKSSRGIWDRDIRQMIVYFLLGRYNGFNFKKCIIFNPRFGEAYEFETKNISEDIIKEIKEKW